MMQKFALRLNLKSIVTNCPLLSFQVRGMRGLFLDMIKTKDLTIVAKPLKYQVRPAGFEPAALDSKSGALSLFHSGCPFSAISASICKIACATTSRSSPRNFLISLIYLKNDLLNWKSR